MGADAVEAQGAIATGDATESAPTGPILGELPGALHLILPVFLDALYDGKDSPEPRFDVGC